MTFNINNINNIDNDKLDDIIDEMLIDIFKPYMIYIKILLNEENIKRKFIIDNNKNNKKINLNVLNEILKKHLDIINK